MANPYLIGGLVVAGLGAAWWATKKPPKKKTSSTRFRLFGDDCQMLVRDKVPSNEEGQKFVNAQVKAMGGYAKLGEAPGNYDLNTQWAQAFATRLFKVAVSPKCISSMGLTAMQTEFGPIYAGQESKMSEMLAANFRGLVLGAAGLLAEQGYQVIGAVIIEEPGLEGGANTPVLADLVRGLS